MSLFGQILTKIFSTIIRHQQREPENIDALIVCGIDTNLAEIKRARIHGAHARPSFTAVLRSKNSPTLAAQIIESTESTFVTLHHCHDHFWIARAECQANPAGFPGK